MLKSKGEDAEAVMATALERGSGSEKEEAPFPEAIPIPARPETPAEPIKREMEMKAKWRRNSK